MYLNRNMYLILMKENERCQNNEMKIASSHQHSSFQKLRVIMLQK
jgi:hypothetical protein